MSELYQPEGWKVVRLFARIDARAFRPAVLTFTGNDAVLPFSLRNSLNRVGAQLDELSYRAANHGILIQPEILLLPPHPAYDWPGRTLRTHRLASFDLRALHFADHSHFSAVSVVRPPFPFCIRRVDVSSYTELKSCPLTEGTNRPQGASSMARKPSNSLSQLRHRNRRCGRSLLSAPL